MRKLYRVGLLSVLLAFAFWGSQFASAELALPSSLPSFESADEQSLGKTDGEYGLVAGQKVASFKINDHFGEPTSFETLLEKGPLLVVFYRGGWCPYCNTQIRSLSKSWPEFEKRGVLPVLISVDKPDGAAIAQREYEIPFPVLSDPGLFAHDAFKVSLQLDSETIELLKGYGISLESWSGKDHQKIAVSSAFLVGKDGIVKWSHSDLNYKKRPKVKQLLNAIDSQL